MDLARMRRDYTAETGPGLDRGGLAATWAEQFGRWFADAGRAGLPEPNAMVVATADPAARPSVRTVLLKAYDDAGLVFYTNLESRKGVEALANPYASAVFPWFPMGRQVIVAGRVTPVDRAEVAAYFAVRPRGSQLAAWASPQSRVIADRGELADRVAAAEHRFPPGTDVAVPPHWGGLRIEPERVEFWQGRPDRLHDRLCFRRGGDGVWVIERLAP